MSFDVKTISVFEKQAKRLMKKFPSLRKEIQTLISELKEEPEKGTSIGHNCYKIRLAIASKGKGKSGSARVITHLVFKDGTVYEVICPREFIPRHSHSVLLAAEMFFK